MQKTIAVNFEIEAVNGRIEFGFWSDLVDWWNSWECFAGDSAQTPDFQEIFYCQNKF